MDFDVVFFAFGLTLFAGLATGIGSLLAFCAQRTNTRFLSLALGFSAGVMIYVSFVEIMVKARDALASQWGLVPGAWGTALAFFGGIGLIAVIDKFIPCEENPHELHRVEEMKAAERDTEKLHRTGVFTALAIAIHNIPEGIAVSVPIFYATGDRKKAFFYSFASGLAEPVGAFVGYLVLMPFMSPAVFGILFAGVAGIMVFISLDELLPAAEEYGEHHLCIYGLVAGMAVMAISLLLFM